VRLLQKYIINPPVKAALSLGIVPPTHVLLETKGRTTGRPWRNPVGNGLSSDGGTFWIVAEHGRNAGYVRNIEADPHVRVKLGRRWPSGTAEVRDDDDPVSRLKQIGRPINGMMVRTMGTALLSVRVDLDPASEPEM
jgi:deazaflavin-dependent oxidoreductase (nitroreductase family)